jgi:hypothetical protein
MSDNVNQACWAAQFEKNVDTPVPPFALVYMRDTWQLGGHMKEPVTHRHPGLSLIFIIVPRVQESELSLVKIPFKFRSGKVELGSGTYAVGLVDMQLRFTPQCGSEGIDCELAIRHDGTESANGTLVFCEYAETYLLSKVFWPKPMTKEVTCSVVAYTAGTELHRPTTASLRGSFR